jgi:hypothetical protein
MRYRDDPEYFARWHLANRDRRIADARQRYRALSPEALMIERTRGRARQGSIPFDISVDDIAIPEMCPVLGIPIACRVGAKGPQDASPSIDRIDPRLGYVRGNVRVISHRANTLKNNASLEELELVLADLRRLRDAVT